MAIDAVCPVCGATRATSEPQLTRIVRAGDGQALVRCGDCRLVYRHPPMTEEQAEEIYNDEYYRHYEETNGLAGALNGRVREHLRARLEWVERRRGVGKLLEIGCAKGHFLECARERGWDMAGIEVSPVAGGEAVAKGLPVHIGPIESAPLPTGHYDFVHMNHVLEHLHQPVAMLKRIREALKPGGLLIVEVPNEIENLYQTLGRVVVPESKLKYAVPSTHQVFFNPKTLCRAITGAGIEVERCRTVRWTIGEHSGAVGRAIRWIVYLLERPLQRAGNIEVVGRVGT